MISVIPKQSLYQRLTFRTQTLRPLINKRLSPAPNDVHDFHVVLALRGEAGDGLAVNDGFVCGRIDDAREDRWAVAAARP